MKGERKGRKVMEMRWGRGKHKGLSSAGEKTHTQTPQCAAMDKIAITTSNRYRYEDCDKKMNLMSNINKVKHE